MAAKNQQGTCLVYAFLNCLLSLSIRHRGRCPSLRSGFQKLFSQDLFQKIQRPRVLALSQPEDCLLAHDWVLVAPGEAD